MTIFRPPRLTTPAVHHSVSKFRRHPRFGGSNGYSVAQRLENIALRGRGIRGVTSVSSIRRWMRIRPFAPTGNKNCKKLHGVYFYLLVVYRKRHPKCNADEMRAFLYRSVIPRVLFSRFKRNIFGWEKSEHCAQKRIDNCLSTFKPCYLGTFKDVDSFGQCHRLLEYMVSTGCDWLIVMNVHKFAITIILWQSVCMWESKGDWYLKFNLILAIDCHGFKHAQLLPVAGDALSF